MKIYDVRSIGTVNLSAPESKQVVSRIEQCVTSDVDEALLPHADLPFELLWQQPCGTVPLSLIAALNRSLAVSQLCLDSLGRAVVLMIVARETRQSLHGPSLKTLLPAC